MLREAVRGPACRAGCWASHVTALRLSSTVGRKRMVELTVVRTSSLPFSSVSSRRPAQGTKLQPVSVADPEMFIPDPRSDFFYPGSDFFLSRIWILSIQDPGSASKNLSIWTPKNGFEALRNIILGFSSRIRILTFYTSRIPDPGVKRYRTYSNVSRWFTLNN